MEKNKTNITNFKGFDCGSLNLISGVRAMGLTSLVVNIAGKSQAKKVLYFALEEMKEHIADRLEKINSSSENIEIIDDVNDIESICEIIRNSSDIDMVVIDKLSLIEAENRETVVLKLKELASKQNVAIIVTNTIPRMINYREDKRPKLDDTIKLNRYCDKVIYLYRDKYYNADYVKNGNELGVSYLPQYSKTLPSVDVELIVAKDHGDTSVKTINVHFDRAKGNYF